MYYMTDHKSAVLAGIALELFFGLISYFLLCSTGGLTYISTATTTYYQVWFLLTFPIWGLFFVRENDHWRSRLFWVAPFLFYFNPLLAVLIFMLRLCNLSGFTRSIFRGFCILAIFVGALNFFFVAMIALHAGGCDINNEQIKVGKVTFAQYIKEVSFDTHPTWILEKRLYLLPDVYRSKDIDEIPDQWDLLDIKVIDDKFIEYKKADKIVRVKAEAF